MAYYLSKDRDQDVMAAYHRYQKYLREHQEIFPPNAFALGTAEWYQNFSDHRCPHDAWLENIVVSEIAAEKVNERHLTIQVRLLGAYHDGHIEFLYPRVFAYDLAGSSRKKRPRDWLYDEFRLSTENHLVHEIEWAGHPGEEDFRWVIEASDIQYRWVPIRDGRFARN